VHRIRERFIRDSTSESARIPLGEPDCQTHWVWAGWTASKTACEVGAVNNRVLLKTLPTTRRRQEPAISKALKRRITTHIMSSTSKPSAKTRRPYRSYALFTTTCRIQRAFRCGAPMETRSYLDRLYRSSEYRSRSDTHVHSATDPPVGQSLCGWIAAAAQPFSCITAWSSCRKADDSSSLTTRRILSSGSR